MINSFNNFIEQNKLLQPNDKVVLAVSGGIDSVVMLDLFHKAGVKFAIAHCNFKLRSDESDEDEVFVRRLAHDYDAEIYVVQCDTADFSKTRGISIQESARELRYSWFNKVCLYNNYTHIAVGHNQDDKIETFFINLFRGAGIKGLRSIPVRRDNIIRPLLFATRKQIEEYAAQNGILHREDSSNRLDYYLRNKIRHQLTPIIEKISPGFVKSVQKSIANLSDADVLLDSVINDKKKLLFVAKPNDTIEVSINDLLNLSPTKIWIYYLLTGFGFIRQISDAICDSMRKDNNTGTKFSSADYELLIDRRKIIIRKIAIKHTGKKYHIVAGQSELNNPIKLTLTYHKNSTEFIFNKSNKVAYFNHAKLRFPLTIRPWQKGDRIVPFGMTGNKLVSDILVDNKVNSFEKESTFVLLSEEKIIWIIGYRASNETRVKKTTENICMMKFK